jgi:cation diffusion facilitator family transporter
MRKILFPKKVTSERVVVTSFLVNISDVLINLMVTYFSGSVVVFSQALQGMADLVSSGFLVIGVKRSKKPADGKHPFGYGRELYFWTLVSALVTFTITAGMSFYFGLVRFLKPEKIDNIALAYAALIFALFTNGYSMTFSLRRILGKSPLSAFKTVFPSSVLLATKKAFLLDLMGMLASLLGLTALVLYSITGNFRFDGLGAMIIGVTMGLLATTIIKGSKELLVGRSASGEIENSIKKTVLSFKNVEDVLDLKTIYLGTEKLLVNLEVHLTDRLTTDEIELLIDRIERKIKSKVPEAVSIQIELESPNIN